MRESTLVDRYAHDSTPELCIPVAATLVTPEEAERLNAKWLEAREWVNNWRRRNGYEPL